MNEYHDLTWHCQSPDIYKCITFGLEEAVRSQEILLPISRFIFIAIQIRGLFGYLFFLFLLKTYAVGTHRGKSNQYQIYVPRMFLWRNKEFIKDDEKWYNYTPRKLCLGGYGILFSHCPFIGPSVIPLCFNFWVGVILKKHRDSLEASSWWVPGRFARESFRPWVVSPWVVLPWVVSPVGRFAPIWWVVLPLFFIKAPRLEPGHVWRYLWWPGLSHDNS